MQYQDMTKKEMQREYHRLCQRYQEYEQQGLQLDLSRGKPAPEQLALSQRMLGELNSRSVLDSEDGTDCRNYGGLDGIPEAKALLAGMIGARPEQVMVGGKRFVHSLAEPIALMTPATPCWTACWAQSRGCRSRIASFFAPCRVMTAILP